MRTFEKSRRRTGGAPKGRAAGAAPADYVERVNLAIDYIVTNFERPVRLVELAEIAAFSPFHFHRVFQGIVGETPGDFAKRLRLDRAVAMMAHGPRRTMTQIAGRCGFASSSDFSRSFRQRFGAAPSAFDLDAWRRAHREEFDRITEQQMGAGPRAGAIPGAGAGVHHARLAARSISGNPDGFRVRIRTIPAMTVAYIRVANPYKGDAVVKAVDRLIAWAERHGFAGNQWLGYQWENPELVPLEHCRYHIAVEADSFMPRGDVGRFRFPEMTVAQVEIKGGIDLELRALRWLYGEWLPRSGYVPDDPPCFEAFIGRPLAHGMAYFELNAWLPVRRG